MSYSSTHIKNLNSSNEQDFALDRVLYKKTMKSIIETTNDINKQKTFFGGTRNRDASSVIRSRALNSVGNGSTSLFFQGSNSSKDSQDALKRVRSGGAIAPAKKTHNYTGAPTMY